MDPNLTNSKTNLRTTSIKYTIRGMSFSYDCFKGPLRDQSIGYGTENN